MENKLYLRNKVGVQDFLLLENYQSEDEFIENLRKRFYEGLIYTNIGQVLVSVNPCKFLDIYNDFYIKQYQNVNYYEVAPHIYALADNAYRTMKNEHKDQCVLISGESGAGKTETSKKILLYLSAVTKSSNIEKINEKLLKSNPILEAFGNAKTSYNDNSSRFGKYMEVEFDFTGFLIASNIKSFLLEKSRVVNQNKGDQNFHIFYHLISGLDEKTLNQLQLRRDASLYYYLNQGETNIEYNIDDSKIFYDVKNAFDVFNFSDEDVKSIFKVLAAIIHMGQIGFFEENNQAVIAQYKPIQTISKLLECPEDFLKQAFTNKSFEVKGDTVSSPLSRDQAIYARDALAKAIYERLFKWLIIKLNKSLFKFKNEKKGNVIGLLDIYGFEIFSKNSFEQFCINYCNEKLHQLFIELTLKSEQEEYLAEEIDWKVVSYFNNETICNLIEEKHKGIISILDEECVRPGDSSDLTFLNKCSEVLANNNFFTTHQTADNKLKKSLLRKDFHIQHYAGGVIYNVDGFLDKNNDLLYRDLKKTMYNSNNHIIQSLFTKKEMMEKKRPITVATQFKYSLNQLMILLKNKEPWYVRCIKPNENKKDCNFSNKIVGHQVKYLGLMENLRLRRFGFAYRRNYSIFLNRYKSLAVETWPNYKGSSKEGVRILVEKYFKKQDDYRFGKTKIFIRFPQTLFYIEDLFQKRKIQLVIFLQKNIRMFVQRKKFKKLQTAVTKISSFYRSYKARQELKQRKWAASKICFFIKGFITRKDPLNEFNKHFINNVKVEWLKRLSKNLPKNVLDKNWPSCPDVCQEASKILKNLHCKWLVRTYCLSINDEKKLLFEEKVIAESIFRNNKANYQSGISRPFEQFRRNVEFFERNIKQPNEVLIYTANIIKLDRHGYKQRKRILVLTNFYIYLLDEKGVRIKNRVYTRDLNKLSLSSLSDGLLIIDVPTHLRNEKGDIILDCGDNIFEIIVKLTKICANTNMKLVFENERLTHSISNGKQGSIMFKKGIQNAFSNKNGILQVVVLNKYQNNNFD